MRVQFLATRPGSPDAPLFACFTAARRLPSTQPRWRFWRANSALPGSMTLKQSSTTRMTTRREYDLLNRLRRVEWLSIATNTLGLVFDYQCNQANQRRRIDNGDGTHGK